MQSSSRMADDTDRGGSAREDTDGGSPREGKVTFDVGDGSPDME